MLENLQIQHSTAAKFNNDMQNLFTITIGKIIGIGIIYLIGSGRGHNKGQNMLKGVYLHARIFKI